jgi:predicted aspartyl protease
MKIIIPIHLLRIEGDGFHLQVKIKINGKPANAILDTGASQTVFDKTRIGNFLNEEKIGEHERLSTGLGTTSMQSQQVTLKKIAIGKLQIPNYHGVILDLSHVNQTYTQIGLDEIDAVVGSDLLEKYKGVIDYGKKTLVMNEKSVAKKKSVKKKVAGKRKK